MEDAQEETQGVDIPPCRWFVGVLADGTYRFITPNDIQAAEQYIGEHGGGIYSHAGFLIFAANKQWWSWLTRASKKEKMEDFTNKPQLDIQNIECSFSQAALEWLEENEEMLLEKGGKYYENIPRH